MKSNLTSNLKAKALSAKVKIATVTGVVAMATISSPVLAQGGDPFDKGAEAGQTFAEKLQGFAPVIFLICFIAAGIMFAFGDMGKRKAMGWLPWIVLAVAVVSGAASVLSWTQGLFN